MNIVYRPLSSADVEAFKALREYALTAHDKRWFAANPQEEKARPLDEWRLAVAETCERVVIGAFDGSRLVGVMSLMSWANDATKKTAHYRGAFVLPEYRHSAVAGNLYRMLDCQAVARGYERSIFGVRADNIEWIQKQIEHGSSIVGEEDMVYADGKSARTFLLGKGLGRVRRDAA